MAASSEFTRRISIDPWPEDGVPFAFEAGAAERDALARRFGLEDVEAFAAAGHLSRTGGEIVLDGRLQAALVQTCVVSLEPVPQRLDQPVRLRFRQMPEGTAAVLTEPDLDPEADDVLPLVGDVLDVGEAMAEELGLLLDPYPHAAGAYAVLPERLGGNASFDEPELERAHPFAVLAELK